MCVAAGIVLPAVPNAWLPRRFGAPSHTALLNTGHPHKPLPRTSGALRNASLRVTLPLPAPQGRERREGAARPGGKVGGALPSGRCAPSAPLRPAGDSRAARRWPTTGSASATPRWWPRGASSATPGQVGAGRGPRGASRELYLCIWLFIYAFIRGAGAARLACARPLTAFSFLHPRQRPVSGRRAPLRWFSRVGGLPAGPRPKEYLAFSR